MKTYTVGFQEIQYSYVTVQGDFASEDEAVAAAKLKYENGQLDGHTEFSHHTGHVQAELLDDETPGGAP